MRLGNHPVWPIMFVKHSTSLADTSPFNLRLCPHRLQSSAFPHYLFVTLVNILRREHRIAVMVEPLLIKELFRNQLGDDHERIGLVAI